MTKINVIVNNSIRIVEDKFTLVDGGNILINDLAKSNVNVSLIGHCNLIQESNVEQFLSEDIQIISLSFWKSPKNLVHRVLNYLYATIKLILVCFKAENFYVYIPSNISIISLMFLRLFKKKYGLYIRGAVKHSRFNGKVRNYKVFKRFYFNTIKKARFNIVTGNYLLNEINKINSATEVVVPMMSVNETDLLQSKSISQNRNLLYVGRIDKEKGIEELIEACWLLKKQEAPFNLKIIGSGERDYVAEITNRVLRFDLDKHIEFVGKINDIELLKNYYRSADVFIFPSHHEGFPRVLYEAMTFGLPIIATDLETYSGTMINGKNCSLIPIANSNALASSIIELLSSKEKRILYSSNSLNYMKMFFKDIANKSHASQVISNFELNS
ncbi:MAG: glycosyltransferase family 4 protein [Flavobacteriaceae bacterium]|nr:glycosyltransferase family 4 protein [Flavobacteriaceae bacterium]